MDDLTIMSENNNRISPPIDSKNFIGYLRGMRKTGDGRAMYGEREDFAKVIDVGEVISEAINQLNTTPKFDEDSGRQLEQAVMVFWDVGNNKVGITNSVYGSADEVDPNPLRKEMLERGGFSMLEIHDHPDGGLLSPDDYFDLLIGNAEKNIRASMGVVILCPNMQVLALATVDTPIYNRQEDAIKFINAKTDEINRQTKRSFIDGLNEVTAYSRGNKISQYDQTSKQNMDLQTAILETSGKPEREINAQLLALAYELNLKLYFSTDKRTFKEFSA
jgi:hypothetical protein